MLEATHKRAELHHCESVDKVNPVEHWGGGIVKVELTDRQRRAFGLVVRASAPELISGAEKEDPTLLGEPSWRLMACLASPRSKTPIWETLLNGARNHGSRTTTVRLYRRSALVWSSLLLNAASGIGVWEHVPPRIRRRLVISACKVFLAAMAKRGKRPKVPDDTVAMLVEQAARRGQGTGAKTAVARRLGADDSTIRRAMHRVSNKGHGPTALDKIQKVAGLSD